MEKLDFSMNFHFPILLGILACSALLIMYLTSLAQQPINHFVSVNSSIAINVTIHTATQDDDIVLEPPPTSPKTPPTLPKTSPKVPLTLPKTSPKKCDMYSGKWVRDDTYPLYALGSCPNINPSFNCYDNGRKEHNYAKWRWQPHDCDIPRMNATLLLETLRGKRLMYVGDSINHGQFDSMVCIIRTVVPESRVKQGAHNQITYFMAKDYNVSIEFFWAPFLVESGKIDVGNSSKDVLKLTSIENHGSFWKDVDILVFNSAHWWTHGNQEERYFQEGDILHKDLDRMIAMEKGLQTWANWIDHNIDPIKTKVFFRGFSPMHFSSKQWNKTSPHKCNLETEPIRKDEFVRPYPYRMKVVDKVLNRMKVEAGLLNITLLSDYRKEAHPSIYRNKLHKNFTKEQLHHPELYGDCSHWCLPGVPDIWNELLFASLVQS